MIISMTNTVDANHSNPLTKLPVSSRPRLGEQDHAVIVLASGLSQRLGQPKQLLSKYGEPLICYMINLALATSPHAVVVVIAQHQPLIADAVNKLARQNTLIRPVMNPIPKTGMAHSLSLGIEALTNLENLLINRVVIMGVDQVLLDSNHLTELLTDKSTVVASSYQCLDKSSSHYRDKDNIIGLPIVINVERLKQWQSALTGDKGLRHLIRALPDNQLSTVINPELSHDIDTPAQLFYARQQGWLDA